jgi:hypothetical protein
VSRESDLRGLKLCSVPEANTVGAVDSSNQMYVSLPSPLQHTDILTRASFSNTGPVLDVFALGVAITAACSSVQIFSHSIR